MSLVGQRALDYVKEDPMRAVQSVDAFMLRMPSAPEDGGLIETRKPTEHQVRVQIARSCTSVIVPLCFVSPHKYESTRKLRSRQVVSNLLITRQGIVA